MHNRLILFVALAAAVIAIYEMIQPDGLALGYGIIVAGVVLLASFLWSKGRRPKV